MARINSCGLVRFVFKEKERVEIENKGQTKIMYNKIRITGSGEHIIDRPGFLYICRKPAATADRITGRKQYHEADPSVGPASGQAGK